MFRYLRKHKKLVLGSLALVAIVLPFFGVGTNFFMSSPQDALFKVNNEKITRGEFDRMTNQIVRMRKEATPVDTRQAQNQAFNELIRLKVFTQEADKFGIEVPDEELQYQLASTPAFQKEGKFDPQTYARTVTQVIGQPLDDFEKSRKKDMAIMHLNRLIANAVHISDQDLQEAMAVQLAKETDAKKKKELMADPEKLRQELTNEEMNLVFNDWLAQLNSNLKVTMVSENFKRTMEANRNPSPPAPPQPAAAQPAAPQQATN